MERSSRRLRLLFLFVMAGVEWSSADVGEHVVYVAAEATGANDGSSWADAYTDLQSALDHAEASAGAITEIWVAAGTYVPSKRTDATDRRSATFMLIDGVSVYGGFAGWESSIDQRNIEDNPTILSGDFNGDDANDFVNYDENAYHVVTAIKISMVTSFDGLTMTGGRGGDLLGKQITFGGGMLNQYSSPTVMNCTFTRNTAGNGAGMYNENGSPNISHCSFLHNLATYNGGGMRNYYSNPIVTECTFAKNSTDFGGSGGGMSNVQSSPTVRGCMFRENEGDGAGGGMVNGGGKPTVTHCTFVQNRAAMGGGIFNSYTEIVLTNCIFVANTAYSGGGIYNDYSDPRITNATFSTNVSTTSGAMRNYNSSPTVTNCVFWHDSPNEMLNTESSAPVLCFSTVEGGLPLGAIDGGENIGDDPLFVVPVDPDGEWGPMEADFRLRPDSPCIDSGLTVLPWPGDIPLPALDLDGKPRVLCGHIDMGAYELGLMGDADCNFVVDLDDFALWSQCAFGPGEPGLCSSMDADGDGDVDVRDFAGFQRVFGRQ